MADTSTETGFKSLGTTEAEDLLTLFGVAVTALEELDKKICALYPKAPKIVVNKDMLGVWKAWITTQSPSKEQTPVMMILSGILIIQDGLSTTAPWIQAIADGREIPDSAID